MIDFPEVNTMMCRGNGGDATPVGDIVNFRRIDLDTNYQVVEIYR